MGGTLSWGLSASEAWFPLFILVFPLRSVESEHTCSLQRSYSYRITTSHLSGVPNLRPSGCMQARMAVNVAQNILVNSLKTLWNIFVLYVTMYLMCGPKQLFFQCGTEMSKGWIPLIFSSGNLTKILSHTRIPEQGSTRASQMPQESQHFPGHRPLFWYESFWGTMSFFLELWQASPGLVALAPWKSCCMLLHHLRILGSASTIVVP